MRYQGHLLWITLIDPLYDDVLYNRWIYQIENLDFDLSIYLLEDARRNLL